MASNLNYGTSIPGNQPQTDNCTPEKYCLNDIATNCATYGGLYQWNELMQYETLSGIQGLCPPGWHIPTETEWDDLTAFYSGNGIAGSNLKDPLPASGFHGLPTGLFYLNNTWAANIPSNLGAMYWTSTSSLTEPTRAWTRGIHQLTPSVSKYRSLKANAFHVRCILN
jgi:uncharacterized protein (TIGR02145 family)